MKKFSNPLSQQNFSDPFIAFDKRTRFYYFLASCQGNELILYRSKHIANILKDGESKIIYSCGHNNVYGPMWAGEMYQINGRWYIYTSFQEKFNENTFAERKHLMILKSKTEDPFDGFVLASKPDLDSFAIDPTISFINGKQYICYSLVDNNSQQVLEIREMDSPISFTDKKAVISHAEYDWEKVEGYDKYTINEGPFFIHKNNRIFIIYSANGCWSDDYCLGLLEYNGGEVCNASSWKKYTRPVFSKGNDVYGVGHASFFYSPDEKELWCAYHCLLESNPQRKPLIRNTCIQKIDFDNSGFPIFGKPTCLKTEIECPSGEQL